MAISVINDSWRRLSFGDPDDASELWVNVGTTTTTDALFYLSNTASAGESLSKNNQVGWAIDLLSSSSAGSANLDITNKVISVWTLVNIAGILRSYGDGGLSLFWISKF